MATHQSDASVEKFLAQVRQHRLMPVGELADQVDDQMLTAR